jgi:hypothetical protein
VAQLFGDLKRNADAPVTRLAASLLQRPGAASGK